LRFSDGRKGNQGTTAMQRKGKNCSCPVYRSGGHGGEAVLLSWVHLAKRAVPSALSDGRY